MSVWVLYAVSWNGENSVKDVVAVFTDEEKAEKFCREANSRTGNSSYSTRYELEEFKTDTLS